MAVLPFATAVLVFGLPTRARRAAAALAGACALTGLALVLLSAGDVFAGEVLRWRTDWLPALGLDFGFRMDGLAWLFAMLIFGIGALIVLYAAYYLDPNDPAVRFFAFLLLFMGAMLGVVLADNLILLAVFWELTSLSSFLLIGYWHHREDARDGARMALAITGAGGLALLGGMLLLGHIAGSYELERVLASGDVIRAHPWYLPALVLVLAGAFTKSAQFPFHFWLPSAMAAPTPVSAYLHSATMVKAGVFLLARMYPALGGTDAWFWIVAPVGLATLVLGAYVAIFQHDLKSLLAYSTISHLGLITLLFGLDESIAVVAGVFHILNHATFKASLFMAAGIVDHETGTRDMRVLNGLWKVMPWTGALAMTAAGAMAGVPLLNGFLSKEMFFAEAVAKETYDWFKLVLPVGATIAGIFSVAYSVRVVHDVFFNGEPVGLPKKPHEPPVFMRLPVEVLVFVCIAVGLAPQFVIGPLLAAGAQAALHGGPFGELPAYTLKVWHGINLPLVMSGIALAGGLLLYAFLQRFINLHLLLAAPLVADEGGRRLFRRLMEMYLRSGEWITATIQNGSLQRYLFLLITLAILAGLAPFIAHALGDAGAVPPGQELKAMPVNGAIAAVFVIGVACALGTAVAYRSRLVALILLGAVGLVVSLTFVYFSAPDLALTQLLVEMVSIILMMLALYWLPETSPPEGAGRRWRDVVVAVLAGGGIAALTYALLRRPVDSIAPFFLEASVPQGGGANVVNVILVDFRGYDTLGEITVLGIAGLVISALLARFSVPAHLVRPALPGEGREAPLLLALVSRLLLPLAVLVSIYLFLRGHNQPGGGFIAGLVLALALILQFIGNGTQWVAQRMAIDFRGWIGAGLLIAGLTGAAAWLFGAPFLTSSYVYMPVPVIGPVPLASAALFDLGVYLTVVGASMVALVSIARLTARREANAAGRIS
ncbi:MAG TPA: monovalent cation/H+ antiporter subunit A [Burkholderiaceae bacterium]|nr:monovalent cation/H+ antiporter subunit A [Burkholderiaceae bacterium]